jgi:hypothetical protein
MKYIILLIYILAVSELPAQKIGIINDPDGYTNIRDEKGSGYNIVGKVKESEQFKFFQNSESNWWAVETIPYYGTPVKGYIHKSRIQPYYPEEVSKCNCGQPYTEDKPVMNVKIGNTNLTICGALMQRQSPNSIKISEFTISNCQTAEALRFYRAVKTCQVTYNGNSLEIVELDRLPVGKRFQWIQTPYLKTKLSEKSGNPVFSDEQLILDLSNITASDIDSFVKGLPNYKGKGYFDEMESLIGKLLICSMKGNEQCTAIFNDVENYLNFTLDGAIKLFYNDCKKVLENRKV